MNEHAHFGPMATGLLVLRYVGRAGQVMGTSEIVYGVVAIMVIARFLTCFVVHCSLNVHRFVRFAFGVVVGLLFTSATGIRVCLARECVIGVIRIARCAGFTGFHGAHRRDGLGVAIR